YRTGKKQTWNCGAFPEVLEDMVSLATAAAREHCGDLWLGFMPDELVEWAAEAGLKLKASVFLAQRNGFQIQVQHFQRC
ncbi:MAG: hypothetical protein VX121_06820, partial [Pseudomonadota bacterium]|nr:hypothetical protein [Pseudomonadota bacterium]